MTRDVTSDGSRDVLLISTMDGAEHCAKWISGQLGSNVEVAATRRAGSVALRRARFGVVVVEESLAELDPEWADQVWGIAGLAIPVQMNFAISGCARLSREIKAALLRRDGEQTVAHRAAVTEIENDLKSAVTGLLLESQLVLSEPTVPASLEPKLRHLVELAGVLRERLRGSSEVGVQEVISVPSCSSAMWNSAVSPASGRSGCSAFSCICR